MRLALPGLYNVYNALAAAALATALGVPARGDRRGARGDARGVRARRDRALVPRALRGRARRRARAAILLVKNPAGANEVLRMLALEPGEHDVLAVLNDASRTAATSPGSGTPTSRCSPRACRHVTCAGTRAAELARAEVRGRRARADRRRRPTSQRRSTRPPRARADDGAPLYALPTYTAMLALRELLVARGEASSAWA